MSQQHTGNAGNLQLSFNTYRLPISLIGDIHQYLSQRPAAEVRNFLNAIDAHLLADEKAQRAEKESREAATQEICDVREEKVVPLPHANREA